MFRFVKYTVVFILIAYTTISKGQTSKNKSADESLLNLFEKAALSQGSYKRFEKYSELNDAILSETTPFNISVLDTDSSINTRGFRYLIHYFKNNDHPPLNDKYNFNICLTPYYSVIHADYMYVGKYNVRELMRLYYNECDSFLIPIPYKNETIPYFGNVKIPEMIYSINIDVKRDNGLTSKSWDDLFFFVNEIYHLFEEVREEIAQEWFSKDYISLTLSEQQAIKAYRPMKIQILLNHDCFDINLPAPASRSLY